MAAGTEPLCPCAVSPPPPTVPSPRQTGEAVKTLLQRLQALQGERVEAYQLFEE